LIGYDTQTLVTTFTTDNQLTPGLTYKFKVRAQNFFGWSDFSAILDIKAATIPEISLAVYTSIETLAGAVVIGWDAPYNNA
jgi:hypothetical protein